MSQSESGERVNKRDSKPSDIEKTEIDQNSAIRGSADGVESKAASHCGYPDNNIYIERITLVLALIAAIASAFSAFYARRQADAAEKALSADQRAWIGPPQVTPKIVGGLVSFNYVFRNSGHTPTRGLHIDGKFIASAAKVSDWEDEIRAYCAEGRDIAIQKSAQWNLWSVVPNSDFIPLISGGPLDGGPTAEMEKRPVLVGCVTYGQSFSAAVNQTGFYAPLYYRNGGIDLPTVYAIYPD